MISLETLKATASNIVETGPDVYTENMFQSDFPQFYYYVGNVLTLPVPTSVFEQFLAMATEVIQPKKWFIHWRYASGLFVAHMMVLYMQTYKPATTENPLQSAVDSGLNTGNVKSASLGDASCSYDTNNIDKSLEGWGTWTSTVYGAQLATYAKLLGLGGTYAI